MPGGAADEKIIPPKLSDFKKSIEPFFEIHCINRHEDEDAKASHEPMKSVKIFDHSLLDKDRK